jgi:hypothetical protein
MSRRKPLAALAAITVGLAVAVPAAGASAATAAPPRPAFLPKPPGIPPFSPPSSICAILLGLQQHATQTGNAGLATILASTISHLGCYQLVPLDATA